MLNLDSYYSAKGPPSMGHAIPRTEARLRGLCAKMKFVAVDGADRPVALETGELHHSRPRPKSTFERRCCWTGSRRGLLGIQKVR